MEQKNNVGEVWIFSGYIVILLSMDFRLHTTTISQSQMWLLEEDIRYFKCAATLIETKQETLIRAFHKDISNPFIL